MNVTELENRIRDAAQKYYTDGSSDLTDAEFDALVDELREVNPNSELFRTGWGYNVNEDSTPGAKVRHKYGEAGSLDKCHNWKELGKTFQNMPVKASLKLDGMSVVLYFREGELVQALTRGDGTVGVDITEKVKYITNYPETFSNMQMSKYTCAVRGEIVMSYNNFKEFQALYDPSAKNPRNSTVGLINSDDMSEALKLLDIVVYTVVGVEGDISVKNIDTVLNMLYWTFPHVAPYEGTYLEEDSFIWQMEEFRKKWYGIYPADGIVLTLYDLDVIGNYRGYTAKAFKFPSEAKQSEVEEVEWRMTKSQYAMPRVRIKPVELAGTTVQYATGYNAAYIRDNKIGPGAVVTVEKRGEIIPNINSVDVSATPHMITNCPDCGHELIWDGVHLKCNNPDCSNADYQDLVIWIKTLAPIFGLGELIFMFYLEESFGENLTVERIMSFNDLLGPFEYKSGHRKLVCDMLNDLLGYTDKKFELATALKALNIPRLGEITANKLAKYPTVIKEVLADTEDFTMSYESEDKLVKIVGVATMMSIRRNLKKLHRLDLISDRIIWDAGQEIESKGKVAITGKISVKRSVFEQELRSYGYEPGEISKDTKFLITDNPNSTSSKNKKADQWGIQKITETEFRQKYLI